MDDGRGRLIMFSLWVSESARMFAFAAIATLMVGLSTAPLAWVAVAAIMGVSMAANWVVGGGKGDLVSLAIVQAVVGLPVIYLAPAVRAIGAEPGLDLGWPLALTGGELGGDAVFGVIVALILALAAWLRGAALLNSDEPESGQRMIFYTGAAALGILLLLERITHSDVDARFLILPFFASALGGMVVNHLVAARDGNRGSAFWGRFMTMAVSGILLSAIAITALAVLWIDAIRAVGHLLGVVAGWILIAIAVPFALLAMGLVYLLKLVRGEGGSGGFLRTDSGVPGNLRERATSAGEGGSSVFDTVVEVIKFPLAIIVLLAIGVVLYLTFRRYLGKRRKRFGADRESVRGDADAGKDLAGLLGRLLPEWMRRRGEAGVERRFPPDEPGISEVFQLYFSYLKAAARKGMVTESGRTPNELRIAMSRALPGTPVDLMTERFNAACYGHEPSSDEVVTRLRSGLPR
ncbi:MAG: DUF4129 domain-containing protein [Chloroflexi bacterium]|nr:DUF4129 domain-containing protein [Chloroflexota bacterium]